MLSNYVIVTDSSADLSKSILEEYGIVSIPLELHFENGDNKYNDEIEYGEFFGRLRAKESVTTSAINMERFLSALEPILEEGKDVLYIGFSSALSATYRAGELAAEELRSKYSERKILTVDSLCASLGEGLLVTLAAKLKRDGASIDEVCAFVLDKRLHLCHEFTVDDLFFLKRGGRVSAATAVIGTVLAIKPVMHVDNEGRLVKVGTARGRRASIAALFEKMKSNATIGESPLVYICHGDCYSDAVLLKNMVEKEYPTSTVMIDYVGPVIASHSGPGTLALFYLGKER